MQYSITPQKDGRFFVNLYSGYAWFSVDGTLLQYDIPLDSDFFLRNLVDASQKVALYVKATTIQ